LRFVSLSEHIENGTFWSPPFFAHFAVFIFFIFFFFFFFFRKLRLSLCRKSLLESRARTNE